MTADTTRLTLPAFAADTLGEKLTATVPVECEAFVRDILAGHLPYGPEYDRRVVSNLRTVSHACRIGELDYARQILDALAWALRPEFPQTTQDGRTVWACCVSSVGPACQHVG
jgi:hypothetical protein